MITKFNKFSLDKVVWENTNDRLYEEVRKKYVEIIKVFPQECQEKIDASKAKKEMKDTAIELEKVKIDQDFFKCVGQQWKVQFNTLKKEVNQIWEIKANHIEVEQLESKSQDVDAFKMGLHEANANLEEVQSDLLDIVD